MKKSGWLMAQLVMVCLLFNLSCRATAHPHNWISLNTVFVLDEQARLIEVQQIWAFDAYYSMMTFADAVNEFGSEKVGLKRTAERMVSNLADYNYFSTLKVNGFSIPLGKPNKYSLYKTKTSKDLGTEEYEQPGLQLSMSFKVEQKVFVEQKMLQWQVFDPTYYIAMEHSLSKNIEVMGGPATECSVELEIPEPSEEMIKYAMQLDQTQRDTAGLGKHFAETTTIRCL